MIIYIDENMSPYLAKGFNILQIPENKKLLEAVEVRSIKEDFGMGAQDEEWIPVAGERSSCVITQDCNINREILPIHRTTSGLFLVDYFYSYDYVIPC